MKLAIGVTYLIVCFLSGYFSREVPGAAGLFIAIAPAMGWFLALGFDHSRSKS